MPPSHPLDRDFFPDRHRWHRYEREAAAAGELHPALLAEHQANAAKALLFGVEYQHKSSVSECRLCAKNFYYGGVVVRRPRHHCRVCGLVVCDSCSRRARLIRRTNGTEGAERVCDVCNELWHLTRHGQPPPTAPCATRALAAAALPPAQAHHATGAESMV